MSQPEPHSIFAFETVNGHRSVMTLRDWFAGQALASFATPGDLPRERAGFAYAIADAMLAERAKGLPPVEPCEPQSPQQVRIVPLAELR